ncbi:MAG: hypothetical protein OT643_02615 [Bacteroidetes bacterium]|jgi:hypothetical protein|nr:hypothetical protein [Bacteroidota bacterium]
MLPNIISIYIFVLINLASFSGAISYNFFHSYSRGANTEIILLKNDLVCHHSERVLETQKLWDLNDPLVWDDFKGEPTNDKRIAALTYSAIIYSYFCDSTKYLNCTVKATFKPDLSWVRNEAKTKDVLAHEQLHFDITEYFARKLRLHLLNKQFACNDTLQLVAEANLILDQWRAYDKEYDHQTHFSHHKEMQNIWASKVAKNLADLKIMATETLD